MEISLIKPKYELKQVVQELNYSEKQSKTNLIKEWVFNFSGHGFSNLLRTKNNLVKLFWLISVILSIGGCIWFIVNSFLQFFSYSIVTTIQVQKVESLTFPAMTFCGFTNVINGSTHFEKKSILSCEFDYKKCEDLFENVTVYASGGFRKCIRFNGKKIGSNKSLLKTQKYGYHYGLRINLFLQKDQIAFLNIGDNYDMPVDGNFINYLRSNVQTDLILKKTVNTNLDYPFNDCVKQGYTHSTDLYRETLESGYNYRRLNCESLCFYKHYTTHCNCSLPEFEQSSGNQPCIGFGDCYSNFRKDFHYKDKCAGCLIECDSVSFEAKTIYTQIEAIDRIYLERLVKEKLNMTNFSEDNLMKHISALQVYFEDMKRTRIDQSPMETVSNLVSNIGGTLGCFLGLSLLSFIEILELLVQIIFYVNSKRQSDIKKKEVKTNNNKLGEIKLNKPENPLRICTIR